MKLHSCIAILNDFRRPPSARQLADLLGRLRSKVADLAPFIRFDAKTYRRNLVADGPGFEVKVLCWRAGQCSPIHDHAGSACGVKVISGIATETTYDVSDPPRPRPLAKARFRPGDVMASFDRDAHRITAADGDLVTLHVYAPKLASMTLFPDETR